MFNNCFFQVYHIYPDLFTIEGDFATAATSTTSFVVPFKNGEKNFCRSYASLPDCGVYEAITMKICFYILMIKIFVVFVNFYTL